jgi:hypothetical protein
MKIAFHHQRILRLETSQKLGTVKQTYLPHSLQFMPVFFSQSDSKASLK